MRHSPHKSRTRSPGKASTEPNLLSHLNSQRMPSPNKGLPTTPLAKRHSNMLNLLDFDLPPQPTPRSIPSISVRELETVKSSYLSEISSLKASLNGREAEIESLKRAVGDAERRVGEALETVREERGAREHAEREKQEWEKKGKEVETVLNSVKEEFMNGEKEREELLQKLSELTQQKDAMEEHLGRVTSRASNTAASTSDGPQGSPDKIDQPEARQVSQRVMDENMEELAHDLHAAYKKKHESKVATLKRTYEARAERKCQELYQRIQDLTTEIDHVRSSQPPAREHLSEIESSRNMMERLESQQAELEEQAASISRLLAELDGTKVMHDHALHELKLERLEKGELVAAVDEMLSLQQEVGAGAPMQFAIEDFRRSLSRPSGLGGPVVGDSKISRFGMPPPSRIGLVGKSKMMSNIERMGSGRTAQ